MLIRGEEVLLPTSTVGAYPRPHWLQGRVFGTLNEPTYRSFNLRVAYEDACKLCARDQEEAGLDILTDGHQYYEWEAAGFQLEPIFHFIPEMLGGFQPYGPPGDSKKYQYFYKPEVTSKIEWKRPIFEGVVNALKQATHRPFKFSFLGPAQQSIIVADKFYDDPRWRWPWTSRWRSTPNCATCRTWAWRRSSSSTCCRPTPRTSGRSRSRTACSRASTC